MSHVVDRLIRSLAREDERKGKVGKRHIELQDSLLDELQSIATSHGLSSDVLERVMDRCVCIDPPLDKQRNQRIFWNVLLPSHEISSNTVILLIGALSQWRYQSYTYLWTLSLQWLLISWPYLSQDALRALHTLYHVFFFYMPTESNVRSLLCAILYRLTKRENVLPHRIRELEGFLTQHSHKEDEDEEEEMSAKDRHAILSLYSLYRSFDGVTTRIPRDVERERIAISTLLKPIDQAWHVRMMNARKRATSAFFASTRNTTNNVDDGVESSYEVFEVEDSDAFPLVFGQSIKEVSLGHAQSSTQSGHKRAAEDSSIDSTPHTRETTEQRRKKRLKSIHEAKNHSHDECDVDKEKEEEEVSIMRERASKRSKRTVELLSESDSLGVVPPTITSGAAENVLVPRIDRTLGFEQLDSASDFGHHILNLSLPDQIASVLKRDGYLRHYFTLCPDRVTSLRLEYWLMYALEEHWPGGMAHTDHKNAGALLQLIAQHTSFSKELLPCVHRFLVGFVQSWNGVDHLGSIGTLLSHWTPCAFQQLSVQLLQPLKRIFFSLAVEHQGCLLSDVYVALLRHWMMRVEKWDKSLVSTSSTSLDAVNARGGDGDGPKPSSLSKSSSSSTSSSSISSSSMSHHHHHHHHSLVDKDTLMHSIFKLAQHIDALMCAALIQSHDNVILQHVVLEYCELISAANENYGVCFSPMPSPHGIHRLLLGDTAMSVTRLCGVLNSFRKEIEKIKRMNHSERPPILKETGGLKSRAKQLNEYIKLVCGTLWRSNDSVIRNAWGLSSSSSSSMMTEQSSDPHRENSMIPLQDALLDDAMQCDALSMFASPTFHCAMRRFLSHHHVESEPSHSVEDRAPPPPHHSHHPHGGGDGGGRVRSMIPLRAADRYRFLEYLGEEDGMNGLVEFLTSSLPSVKRYMDGR